jgi:hypothetical protein
MTLGGDVMAVLDTAISLFRTVADTRVKPRV